MLLSFAIARQKSVMDGKQKGMAWIFPVAKYSKAQEQLPFLFSLLQMYTINPQ